MQIPLYFKKGSEPPDTGREVFAVFIIPHGCQKIVKMAYVNGFWHRIRIDGVGSLTLSIPDYWYEL